MNQASLEALYVSVGCNTSPHCVAWRGDLLLYGAVNAVAVVQTDAFRTLTTLNGHQERVNCVRWILDDVFVSASADQSAIVWQRKIKVEDGMEDTRDVFESCFHLKGHTCGVNLADGMLVNEGQLVVVTASGGDSSLKIWSCHLEASSCECMHTLKFPDGSFALDVRLSCLPGAVNGLDPLLITSTDDCKVNLYTVAVATKEKETANLACPQLRLVLSGHEDWVRCIDTVLDPSTGDLLIATGGQDCLVRVWRMSHVSQKQAEVTQRPVKALDEDEDIKLKEAVFQIHSSVDVTAHFSVRIETILAGHEDKVFGLQWDTFRKSSSKLPSLLTCSMDKTMIVWQPSDNESDVWKDCVRLGEVGGNTMGFLGCRIGYGGSQLLGYGFSGALHLWVERTDGDWEPGVCVGGHFGAVEDLDWEKDGSYLVSVSSDQTTRIHAAWNKDPNNIDDKCWYEIARPQIHGYNMSCVTMLPGHKMASGAEEKIVRTFEAPKIFVDNLKRITGCSPVDASIRVEGASVPSLGLSNKAVVDCNDVALAAVAERHVKERYSEFNFYPESHVKPPPEDYLVQNSLWPEVRKLYGHGNEIFAVCSNVSGTLIASSCRATKIDQADVILWNTTTWEIVQRLKFHTLTVIQMAFSPCENFLLCVSRDRTWSLYEKNKEKTFILVANIDKKNCIHQRLIWSCVWTHDSKYFATGSRDKKVIIWSRSGCDQVMMTFSDAVTALAFYPNSSDKSYFLAVGLESGRISIVKWTSDEWKILTTLNADKGHHKTVKRLKFRPGSTPLLASCGADHAVKLFRLNIT